MGEHTEIQWTDHTFNPWWGCVRVSEACQHCYAEALAARFGTGWGKAAERRFFGDKHWNEPLRWNRRAELAGKAELVFCASMADVFEDHPALPDERLRLWDLVSRTPWLTWQLLTKRPENIMGMVPADWRSQWPVNVWAGTTVENQRWADERLPILAIVPAPVVFGSFEPLFGAVDLSRLPMPGWVIAGGESGQRARPSHVDWFRSLRDQSVAAGVPFLFKQWGEWGWPACPGDHALTIDGHLFEPGARLGMNHLALPTFVRKVGKKVAGRTLDGRTWDQIPGTLSPPS